MTYDALYGSKEDHILWPDKPGRLILKINEFLKSGTILDAACGDGKNALYLEHEGFEVTGFDKSYLALDGLQRRFQREGENPRGKYEQLDLMVDNIIGEYDAVVSYGLYHCLPTNSRVERHKQLHNTIKQNGYMFFATLTDRIPLPECHGTEGIKLASLDEIDKLLEDLQIIYRYDGEIIDEHLPIIDKHKHSVLWIVAQKR